jgi:hypothetical protein
MKLNGQRYRSTSAQRGAHQMILARQKPPAQSLDCRVKVEKFVRIQQKNGIWEEKWVLCARAPSVEAAKRHAISCGGKHKIIKRGEELVLVYDDLKERLE